ncbi:Formation of crista junctions protein 1 [Onygenales sp. PD_40]|nr:Formation of crista junctions protein 1 [Onygenales sp. PD_40]
MLRTSIASSRQLLSAPASAQWLRASRAGRGTAGKRHYAVARTPKAVPKPSDVDAGRKATFATTSSPHSANPSDPNVRSPASPSTGSAIHPEGVPKPPPSPASQGQTSPGSAVPPPEHTPSPPPPSPPPAPKTGRLRRLLLYLFLTTGLAYAGGVWYSLRSDNFHDFFTEYVPYGEEAVLYLEERDFRRRFPNVTRQISRRAAAAPREEGSQVTIPSKSGLSWKVSEEKEKKEAKPAHMSALDAEAPAERTKVVEKAKEEVSTTPKPAAKKEAAKEKEEAKPQAAAKAEAKVVEEAPRQPAIPAVTTIVPLELEASDEPVVQDLVKVFNDIITVIGADETAGRFSAPVAKAKEELAKIGARIVDLRNDAHASAQEEIKEAHATFDKSATELIRRIEEVRAEDAAQYREEFEAEREKIVKAYQEKINTEIQRAQEVAEQRLRNELVEQAIELNRKFLSDVATLVENEREGRLSKLSELTANVAELERLTADWNEVVDVNLKTQQLQVAVDAVRTTLETSDIPRPFIRELAAVKELASNDPVVAAAIASISPASYQRGIPSPAQLVDRFRRVAAEVRKASLLPENAGITSHAASLVLSKVMFKKQGSAVGDDVESVLTRTENLLEEGNFDEAAREMNGLQGWARMLSKDWLADVRRALEVKQALEVIETEARLRCLQVE